VGIKALDLQDHGIKNGLRDTLIPQCWGSKHSAPAAVAFAFFLIPEFWGSKHKTHKIIGSKVACATLCSPYAGEQNNLIPQQWPSRLF
jgi:hypothetical protein